MKKSILLLTIATTLFASCKKNEDGGGYYGGPKEPEINANVMKAAGDSAAIIGTINQFRAVLGDSLNNAPGKTSGRREVNWDGVPANFTNNNDFPLDFFNNTDPAGPNGRKRGLVYLATGSPIRLDSSSFSEIDPSYSEEFSPFSKKKALISATSNASEIAFKVAGTSTYAFVKGFGIIFNDVDQDKSTSLQFYEDEKLLGEYFAPVRNDKGSFSFLGVEFPDNKVTRIKIISGNAVLALGQKDVTAGGSKDLVVYDDFFYSEPQSIQ